VITASIYQLVQADHSAAGPGRQVPRLLKNVEIKKIFRGRWRAIIG